MHLARKLKAVHNVRDCMISINETTSEYENAMLALRLSRDAVTKAKMRLYRMEKEVSAVQFMYV